MANQWFRLYSEFSTDQKVQMLSESDQRRLIMLFCFRCNGSVTLQDDEVTFLLRISNEEWKVTKALFVAKGFINNDNELLNWDKRQFISDSSAERVARHRAKKKQPCNVTVTPPEQNRTEQIQNRIKEKSKKENPKDLLPDIPEQLLNDFIQLRKQKKAPITRTAIEGIKKEAAKADLSLENALIVCCERNWQGFKAEWYQNANAPPINGNKQNYATEQLKRTDHSGQSTVSAA